MSFEEEYDKVNRLWDESIEKKNKRIKDLEAEVKQLKYDLEVSRHPQNILSKEVVELKEQNEKIIKNLNYTDEWGKKWYNRNELAESKLVQSEEKFKHLLDKIGEDERHAQLVINEWYKKYKLAESRLVKAQDNLKAFYLWLFVNGYYIGQGDITQTESEVDKLIEDFKIAEKALGDA